MSDKCKGKKCPAHQICNPKTGRFVNKDGKIGQEILRKGKFECKNDNCKDKNCPVHQMCNPKTGRCVNKSGDVGQEILLKNGKKATPVGPGVPNNFLEIVDDCEINKVWKTKNELGRGKHGIAYVACKAVDDCNYVLKVQKLNHDFYTEVSCLEEFKNTKGIVPKIYAAWSCDNRGYFVIQKLYTCPEAKFTREKKETYKEVDILLKRFREKGWLHVDIHPGNVMCNNKGKLVLIDFGWSVKKGKKSYPDNPLSKILDMSLTFTDLELAQKKNKEEYFGYDNKKYLTAVKNWEQRKAKKKERK